MAHVCLSLQSSFVEPMMLAQLFIGRYCSLARNFYFTKYFVSYRVTFYVFICDEWMQCNTSPISRSFTGHFYSEHPRTSFFISHNQLQITKKCYLIWKRRNKKWFSMTINEHLAKIIIFVEKNTQRLNSCSETEIFDLFVEKRIFLHTLATFCFIYNKVIV